MADKQSNTTVHSSGITTIPDADMQNQDINFIQVAGGNQIDAKIKDSSGSITTQTLATSETTHTKRRSFSATNIGLYNAVNSILSNFASSRVNVNSTSTRSYMGFCPNDYVLGTDIIFHAIYSPSTTTAGDFRVRTVLERTADGEVVGDGSNIIDEDTQSSIEVVNGIMRNSITIGGSTIEDNDIISAIIRTNIWPTGTDLIGWHFYYDYTAYLYL